MGDGLQDKLANQYSAFFLQLLLSFSLPELEDVQLSAPSASQKIGISTLKFSSKKSNEITTHITEC